MFRGIALGFLTYLFFSSTDATTKELAFRMSVFEKAFFITIFGIFPMFWMKPRGMRWRVAMRVTRPGLLAIRACCGLSASLLGLYAFTALPLAEAYALIFLIPFFVTLLSKLVLKEHVPWQRWATVAVGLVGVLLVVRPGFKELALGHLAAIGVAFASSITIIILRTLAPTEKPVALLGWVCIAVISFNGIAMLPSFTWPSTYDLGLTAMAGVFSGLGSVCLITAMRLAPASRIGATQYSQIIWAVLLGWIFFHERPDDLGMIGVGFVVLSGILAFLTGKEAPKPSPASVET